MRVKRPGLRLSRLLGAPLLIAALAAGASGASCGDDDEPTTPAPVHRPAPDLRLVVLTDLKGYLEPCGCTSRPLGGIDRTAAKLRDLRGEGPPVLTVAAGDLLFDGIDHAVAGGETQQIWKAETVVDILDAIHLDAATPGATDLQHGVGTFRDLIAAADFPVLAAGVRLTGDGGAGDDGASDAQEGAEGDGPQLGGGIVREVGGVKVGIFGVSEMAGPDGTLPEGIERTAPVREAARDAARRLREQGAQVLVALVRGDSRRTARQVATGVDGVDFVVQAGLDQADPVPPSEAGGAWLLNAGRQGQGLVVVDLFVRERGAGGHFTDWSDWTFEEQRAHLEARIADLRERIAEWEGEQDVAESDLARQRRRLAEMEQDLEGLRPPADVEGNAFSARYVELPPEAPRDAAITRIMERHFRRVNEHNREVFADLEPPPAEEGQPVYVGSAACESCHEAEYAWWRGTKHGRAYATLTERHKQYNLDCVGCHVTGYMQPGGSTVTHLGDGGVLENVGCEQCHGPGSLHAAADEPAQVDTRLDPPESVCAHCHTPEHSDTFDYRAYHAMLLAPGHGMPTPQEREQEQEQAQEPQEGSE